MWTRTCDVCHYDPAAEFLELSEPQVVPAEPNPPVLPPRTDRKAAAASNQSNKQIKQPQSQQTTTSKGTTTTTTTDVVPASEHLKPHVAFVIEDYDVQLHEALQQWQTAVAIHTDSRNLFVDNTFKAGLESLVFDTSKKAEHSNMFDPGQRSSARNLDLTKIHWKRPHQIQRDNTPWSIFRSPMPSDIQQGVLGDCWLVSALSLIACDPLLLHKIFITPDLQPTGAYALRLCIDGRWQVLIVDDLLPCYGRHGGGLVFSKATRNQLWVPLIEKAMAKAYGCYESLAGGHTYEGLSALTGECVETFALPDDKRPSDRSDSSAIDPEELWIKLISYLEARFLIGASCGRENIPDDVYNQMGLIKNHAYAVLAVHSSLLRNGKPLQLVKLRNPWGSSDWLGDWSDASPLWRDQCPTEVRHQLAPYGQNEGVFWMAYSDFVLYFANVDVCKVRPEWREYRITSRFLRPPANSAVVVLLTIVETTQVELMLHQHGLRSQQSSSPIDLFVFLVKLQRVGSNVSPGEIVRGATGSRRLDAFVQAGEYLLEPGEYAAVVFSAHAATNTDRHNTEYTLSVHSARALVVDPIVVPRSFVVDSFISYVRQNGRKYYGPGDVVVSYCSSRFAGLALLVDNGARNTQLRVECDCNGSENVLSSRGLLKSCDVIPPSSCQLVQILTPLEPRQRWHVVHHLKHSAQPISTNAFSFFGIASSSSGSGGNGSSRQQTAIPEDIAWLHSARPIVLSPQR